MKIRSGFVSNSSSSSFVVLGVKLEKGKFNEMGGYEFFEDHFDYVDFPEGYDYAILGHRIGRWSENDGDIGEADVEGLAEVMGNIKQKLQELFPDQPAKVKLLYGSVYG